MDKGFKDMCMLRRMKEIQPSAVEISNPVEMGNLAKSHKRLGEYFFEGSVSEYFMSGIYISIIPSRSFTTSAFSYPPQFHTTGRLMPDLRASVIASAS